MDVKHHAYLLTRSALHAIGYTLTTPLLAAHYNYTTAGCTHGEGDHSSPSHSATSLLEPATFCGGAALSYRAGQTGPVAYHGAYPPDCGRVSILPALQSPPRRPRWRGGNTPHACVINSEKHRKRYEISVIARGKTQQQRMERWCARSDGRARRGRGLIVWGNRLIK